MTKQKTGEDLLISLDGFINGDYIEEFKKCKIYFRYSYLVMPIQIHSIIIDTIESEITFIGD